MTNHCMLQNEGIDGRNDWSQGYMTDPPNKNWRTEGTNDGTDSGGIEGRSETNESPNGWINEVQWIHQQLKLTVRRTFLDVRMMISASSESIHHIPNPPRNSSLPHPRDKPYKTLKQVPCSKRPCHQKKKHVAVCELTGTCTVPWWLCAVTRKSFLNLFDAQLCSAT